MMLSVGHIAGPEAWRAEDLAASTDWTHRFTESELADLDAALAAVTRRGLGWHDLTRADFPLTVLGPTLARVSDQLEHGRGLVLLRGLPVARYNEEELRRLFWGIGVHLGTPRHQNARNLRANSAVTLALEARDQGYDVVMLQGRATFVDDPAVRGTMPEFVKKYADVPRRWSVAEWAEKFSVPIRVIPTRLVGWMTRPGSLAERTAIRW
jgi:hypothetical protein